MLQYLYSSSILSASFLPVFRRLWFYTEFFDFFNLDSLRNTLQQVTTLDDVLYLGMKNDISFLIDSYMNLYEAQSTLNPNMPLRGLFYFSRLYSSYAENRNFLSRHRAEAKLMILSEYNEELHKKTLLKEGREEGRREGRDITLLLFRYLKEANRMDD